MKLLLSQDKVVEIFLDEEFTKQKDIEEENDKNPKIRVKENVLKETLFLFQNVLIFKVLNFPVFLHFWLTVDN